MIQILRNIFFFLPEKWQYFENQLFHYFIIYSYCHFYRQVDLGIYVDVKFCRELGITLCGLFCVQSDVHLLSFPCKRLFFFQILVTEGVPSLLLYKLVFWKLYYIFIDITKCRCWNHCIKQENIASVSLTVFWLPVPHSCSSEEWNLCMLD